MNCTNTTSPIDIVKMNSKKCNLKCDFSFDYKYTSVRVTNKDEYFLYTFDRENISPVIFNNEKYNVDSMRLYQPSLHTYNGKNTDAEILIIHNHVLTNNNLIVCIPIKNNSSSQSQLDLLINQSSQMANKKNSSAKLTINNFSLKSFVPKKPFFFYNGTLPYVPCNGIINYIVYDINDSLSILNNSYNNLKTIISKNNITSIKGKNVYYNKNGPNKNNLGDEIYIDCQPTGDNGEILISKSISVPNVNPKVGKYLTYTLLSIIVVIILYYVIKFLLTNIFGPLYKNKDFCEGSNCITETNT